MPKLCCLKLIPLLTAILFAFIDLPAHGELGQGGYAGSFLRIGIGARPLGMGGAFVASADDATASYWNPAGLGQLDRRQIAAMYSVMSMHRTYSFVGYVQRLKDFGTIEMSWINLWIRNIDGRDLNGKPTKEFSDAENVFLFSFGKKLSPALLIGGNFKYFSHKLADRTATGTGFDFGAILIVNEKLQVGATIQDISSYVKWNTLSRIKEKFPTSAKLGVIITPITKLRILVDVEKNNEQDAKYHLGTEYWFCPSIAVRIGYNKNMITAGGSILYKIQIDYAFSPDVLQQGLTHRISLLKKF